jgi:hypothetical protein
MSSSENARPCFELGRLPILYAARLLEGFPKAAETLSERSLEQIEDVEIRGTRAIALGIVVVISPLHSLITSHISPHPSDKRGGRNQNRSTPSFGCVRPRPATIEPRKNVLSH